MRFSIAALLAVCSCHPYNQTYYTSSSKASYLNRNLVSPIVEFDDDGYMRTPWQLDSALAAMDTAARNSPSHPSHPVVVLVFIHGWHNNAAPDNDNLREFNDFARALEARLHAETATATTTVLPIYFAWRGQNTWNPHWYNTYAIPFIAQYLTFFSRKATAERIGRGSLEVALARISRKWHEWRSSGAGNRQNYLIIVGHSFGGAALLTATLPQLVAEQEVMRTQRAALRTLRADVGATDSLRRAEADIIVRAQAVQSALAPADLLIAVNPVIESSMLDRTVLADGAPFARDGAHPQLLILDADNDRARSVWFPIGEWVSNVSHVRTPHSKAEREAVAKMPGQVTFVLSYDVPESEISACDSVHLQPRSLYLVAVDRRPCTNSVMVIRTRDKIIDGHNGIWGNENREFLIHFVGAQHAAYIQALR